MIYDLGLAWRNIRNRPVETLIPIFIVALAIALSVAVITLADGTEEGIVQASDPFGVLVVGAAGSGQELILSSVLLQGNPIGNIPYKIYEDLEADARVQLAVPLAFGDNVGGARIIGTDHNFFELRTESGAESAFQLAAGRLFTEEEHNEEEVSEVDEPDSGETHTEHNAEAVLGSKAASRLGLQIGDQFVGTHGVGQGIAENTHEDMVYTVVGVLKPSGTAYDTAIYTQLESIWHVHEEDETNSNIATNAVQEASAAPSGGEVTSILILPTSFIGQNQLAQQYYTDPTLQVAFPGEELNNLLDLLNQGQQVLNIVGQLVLGIAGLTLFLSMYSAIIARQQAIAVMRGLGSSRITVFRVVIFETLIVSITGALVGRILGYTGAFVVAEIFSEQSAIPIPLRFLPELESLLWMLSLGVGLLAGLIPALMAYRVNVVEKLFPA